MDAEYFKSSKFAFAVTAGFVILMTGYKMATRPDLPTQIAERRAAAAFPGGEPSPALRGKPMVEGMTSLNLTSTLDEFEQSLRAKNHELAWEPENDPAFASGAIAVTAMAINGEVVDPRLVQNFLLQIQTDIDLKRQRGTP